jgi:dihydroneopterin aldolase
MKLFLNAIDVDCVIGDLPEERNLLQRLKVDVELKITDGAATTDALEDTVDYASLTSAIRDALISAQCRMIERAAKIVHDVCMAQKGVLSARVRVEKAGAVEHLQSAAAEYF